MNYRIDYWDPVLMKLVARPATPDEITALEAAYTEPEPVPQVVSIRQAQLALLAAGVLDDVEAFIASADRVYQIEWQKATEVRRDHALVGVLKQVLQMTDTQIDELFRTASKL